MFTRLGIQNFKAWKGPHTVELRPVTLLLGTNSAGKTSLLQPILLLQQTVRSPDRKQALNLGGQATDLLHLGTMEDVLSGHDKGLTLGFDLSFLPTVRDEDESDEDRSAVVAGVPESKPFAFHVEYATTSTGAACVQRMSYVHEGTRLEAVRQQGGAYLLEHDGRQDPTSVALGVAKRAYEPERSVAFSAEAVAALGQAGDVAQDNALLLTRELQALSYLGPLRERPQRFYSWNGSTPGDLGTKGELAIHALLASANGRGPKTLLDDVSRWLSRMEIADSLRLEQQGRSNVYEVRVTRGDQDANLVDVGFGIAQVLPIVTLAFFAPEGSTVILEQPELHLHPLAQAHLANLLVEVAQERRLQFLVETHSEHLFRRLQFLIADMSATEDQCALYFVDRDEAGYATLNPLEMDEFGRIKNWPPKFFGDAVGEAERQMRAVLMRKKGVRRSA